MVRRLETTGVGEVKQRDGKPADHPELEETAAHEFAHFLRHLGGNHEMEESFADLYRKEVRTIFNERRKLQMRSATERKDILRSHGGLTIKCHNGPVNDLCPVCGEGTRFFGGPELTLADCDLLVCHDCVRRYEPELIKLLAGEPACPGECPVCWHHDGCLMVGRSEWAICRIHRVCWNVGSNLYDYRIQQTEETRLKNAKLLKSYQVIQGFFRTKPDPRVVQRNGFVDWR